MADRVRNLQPGQRFRLKRTGDLYEFLGHKRDTPGGTQYVVRRSGFAKPSTPAPLLPCGAYSGRPIMTNQQGAPETLRLADALECRTTSWPDKVFAAAELRRLHAENVRLAALVDAQQPATHVQNPAEIEHVAGDVSKTGPESNMAQQPAPSAACPVGNSGFDHQTAADVLNGKTVSDEVMRKFVAAARWAHDDRVGLRATLLSVRGELASREAEIALLKKALMDAEAPQPSPTPQAAPAGMDMQDAYVGAREGLAIWKRRALVAERDLRAERETASRLAAEIKATNGPTRMGEPVTTAQPAPAATPQADSQPAPAVGYPPLPRVGAIGYASVVDIQIYAKTLTIGPHLPGVRDIALWTTDQMRAYVDADRTARAQADSVTAPAGGGDDDVDAIALARYKVVPAHESMFHRFAVVAGDGKQQLYIGREVECENMARKFAGAFLDGAFYQSNIATTPPIHAAGNVLDAIAIFLVAHLVLYGFTGLALWGGDVGFERGFVLIMLHVVGLFAPLIARDFR